MIPWGIVTYRGFCWPTRFHNYASVERARRADLSGGKRRLDVHGPSFTDIFPVLVYRQFVQLPFIALSVLTFRHFVQFSHHSILQFIRHLRKLVERRSSRGKEAGLMYRYRITDLWNRFTDLYIILFYQVPLFFKSFFFQLTRITDR